MNRLFLVALAAVAMPLTGCTRPGSIRPETYERILLPLMSDVERAEYYSRPTPPERKAYLDEMGLTAKLDAAPPHIRQAILDERVVKGMTPEQVMMSWGSPEQRQRLKPSDNPEVAQFQGRKERWFYDRLITIPLSDRFLRAVEFTNGVVLEVRDDRPGHENG